MLTLNGATEMNARGRTPLLVVKKPGVDTINEKFLFLKFQCSFHNFCSSCFYEQRDGFEVLPRRNSFQ